MAKELPTWRTRVLVVAGLCSLLGGGGGEQNPFTHSCSKCSGLSGAQCRLTPRPSAER